MKSFDVITKVTLLPKGGFHNLKISQKQDKREQKNDQPEENDDDMGPP